MGIFKYTKGEKEINKVIKMNQEMSQKIHNSMTGTRKKADSAIAESESLLCSLGMGKKVEQARTKAKADVQNGKFSYKPEIMLWEDLVAEANGRIPDEVTIEQILTPAEINSAFREVAEINKEFSRQTGILNKTDLSFLAIATALQTAKSLIYPVISQKKGYGSAFDKNLRSDHKAFEHQHKKSAKAFVENHQKRNPNGYWINMVYQTVPYDAIKGSRDAMGKGLAGNDHRLRTLGHDPVLGWIFGFMNILTDTVTLNTFDTYRVARNPLVVTPQIVSPVTLIAETFEMIKGDKMNLPAAIFTEAIHLKSDIYSKCGLPVPVLSTFNESFATELYKNQYDALCFARDAKFIAGSAGISILFDIIIGLIHSLFFNPKKDRSKKFYEVRTRKILLISNTIASSSSIIAASITENPKCLDIGGLLVTIAHLFTDLRFIAKVKQEFIENEMNKRLQRELNELDTIYNSMI